MADSSARVRSMPAAARPRRTRAAGAVDVERTTALTRSASRCARVLGRERSKRRIDLDQRDPEAGNAGRQRKPGSADAGAEIRPPARRHAPARRRQQDRIMAETMATRAAGAAAAGRRARHRRVMSPLAAHASGRSSWPRPASFSSLRAARNVLVRNQHAPRQHADRAFQHAHVLVEHDVRDLGRIEQRLDRRNQHRVIGANEFAHACLPDARAFRAHHSLPGARPTRRGTHFIPAAVALSALDNAPSRSHISDKIFGALAA